MEINHVQDNGTRIILKGRHIDWFADTGCLHPHHSDRDYTTPMKEDLAIRRADFWVAGSWVNGGVSVRSIGGAISDEIAGVLYSS